MFQILQRVSSRGTQTNHKNDKMQNKKVISFYDNYPKTCRHSGRKNSQDKLNLRVATQYNDLLQLIKFQREKITAQQMELQKVRIFLLFRMISYITYCLFILFPSVRYGNSILGEQGTGPRPRARGHIARDLQGGPNLSSRQRTAPDPAVCGGGKRIGQAAGEDSEVGNCSAPIQAGKLRD